MRITLSVLVTMAAILTSVALVAHADDPGPTPLESYRVGVSEDGQTWLYQDVLVPVDGYVVVDFGGGNIAYVWGSEFDPEDLPEGASDLCNCNAFVMKCKCENYCRKIENNITLEGHCR